MKKTHRLSAALILALVTSSCNRHESAERRGSNPVTIYQLTIWGKPENVNRFFHDWRPNDQPSPTKLKSPQADIEVYRMGLPWNTESEDQRAIIAAKRAGVDYDLRVVGQVFWNFD